MKVEMETAVLQPRARECLQPPEAGKAGESALDTSEGAWPCRHLDLRLLASRDVTEYIPTAVSHLVCGYLLWEPLETKTARLEVSASPTQMSHTWSPLARPCVCFG